MKFPEEYRQHCGGTPFASKTGDPFGIFKIPPQRIGKTGITRSLQVMATDGYLDETQDTGWEHISVTLFHHKETPSWEEMMIVRKLFWEPEACVVQFSPPESDHVNIHEGCLHWWRSRLVEFPMPPKECV